MYKGMKRIKGFDKYFVTESGQIYSIYKKGYLKPAPSMKGYLHLTLMKNRKINKVIHRLVAEAFIPNPENKPEVNHKDCNKLNNHFSNLEWCTRSENIIHSYKNNLRKVPKGEKHWNAKLTWDNVEKIKRLYKNKEYNQKELANIFKIHQSLISRIVNNLSWEGV